MAEGIEVIKPQKGPQEMFLASKADIVIFGGSAGGGKSYALLMEPIRYVENPQYGAVIFRKNSNQITAEGGLWDTAMEIYSKYQGAEPRTTPSRKWIFPSGASVGFAHIERDMDVHSWQGTQICYIGFDELTHFSEYSFFYMLSRNRSTCGVKPCVRCTTNPDAESWVARFIDWWIDPDTGYPIQERNGKKRWFVRINNAIYWSDTRKGAVQLAVDRGVPQEDAEIMPKSVAFIKSSLDDNQKLLQANPQYRANLLALPEVEKERLLSGNWKIKPQAGLYFKRVQVTMIKEVPRDMVGICRGWDLACTTEDEDGESAFTAGVLMGRKTDGVVVILDVINQRLSAGDVLRMLINVCGGDNRRFGYVRTRLPQDPAQAGKAQAQYFIKQLAGYDVVARPEGGSKENRASPVASQWQMHNVEVLEAPWNDEYFSQMESFPEGKFKDMVDATSSAFNELTQWMDFNIDGLL